MDHEEAFSTNLFSYIKNESNNENDYPVQAITFKQLIHDFVYANEDIKKSKITFIKCDIEGGEEDILEDILYFAYYNKTATYISFHIDWWKNKNIAEFEQLFKFFNTNCPEADIVNYIRKNPFASILFVPRENAGILIKKNMPVVVIGYNQYTYVKNMVTQLEKYTSDIIVVDNNSTYDPLLNYYKNNFGYTLLRQKKNYGHSVFRQDFVQQLVGDVYLLTDPDLKFTSNLPANFINSLIDISNHFKAQKVGFALSIDSDQIRTDVQFHGNSIKEWESQFWKKRLEYPMNPSLELYGAAIDTTFCLINKKFIAGNMIRIAGNYTCLHLPWFKDFKDHLLPGEYDAYLQGNISTSWFK